MTKQNSFEEFDTTSRRKFLESLGMRFYNAPVFERPARAKKEKTEYTVSANEPGAALKERVETEK